MSLVSWFKVADVSGTISVPLSGSDAILMKARERIIFIQMTQLVAREDFVNNVIMRNRGVK
jgi:hypothetical protein